MIRPELLNEIESLGHFNDTYKPHKHIALLVALEIIKEAGGLTDRIYYDARFTQLFEKYLKNFGGRDDRNRPYNPFFHLRTSSFWRLVPRPGKDDELDKISTIGGPGLLKETISYAEVDQRLIDIIQDNIKCKELEALLYRCLRRRNSKLDLEEESQQIFTELTYIPNSISTPNHFVAYLNSLHSIDAGNENAMAESQACNPDFSRIHVAHPLVQVISDQLSKESGKSVILTGHAGDGKSTLALSVYKKFKGMDPKSCLTEPLKLREDIVLSNSVSLAIIKDFSEWPLEQRHKLLDEITINGLRVLLISNTGALLDTFCEYSKARSIESLADLRPRLLEAMDAESESLEFGGAGFRFYNLALHDNLDLAQQVFGRMLSPENWEACTDQVCRETCPIYRNVQLFREQEGLPQERIFLAYRRMYEYGTRLTMRQFTAHLAYMFTAGLEYADIMALTAKAEKPLLSDYLFYNRFFGDNGRGGDDAAGQMPVIRAVRSQGFGERPCPAMERHLWLLVHHDSFQIGLPLIEDEFQRLRRHGARMPTQGVQLTPDQAREQARRLLYFLYKDVEPDRQKSFLQNFLGSLAILRWKEWQGSEAHLSLEDESRFKQRVFHVLQEQFTGVRLAEMGSLGQSHLYITLSRRRQDIRQSAQVVLAQIDFPRDFKLKLTNHGPPTFRRDLALIGQGWLSGIVLDLNLPFLDYVLARHQGQVGETLQAAYSNRLERLKADLIEHCQSNSEEEMILVRLRTNHTFRRQHFKVVQERLEVSDA